MVEYFEDSLFLSVSKHYWFGFVTIEEYICVCCQKIIYLIRLNVLNDSVRVGSWRDSMW